MGAIYNMRTRAYIILKNLFLMPIAFAVVFSFGCSNSVKEKTGDKAQNSSAGKELTSTDNTIKSYQARIKLNPDDYSNYNKLGEAYIQKARETGDTAYYDKAEEMLKNAFELYPESYASVVFLGQVSSAKHEFQQTLVYAKKAIEIRPEDSYAYGILGDAYVELGEYDKAQEAYQKMLILGPNLYSYSRISHIRELTGDTERTIRAMQKAIEEGVRQDLPKENIAWALYILGEAYFNTGNLKKAEEQYKASAKTYDGYYYALAGLAKAKAAEKKYQEAIELYKKAIGIIPLPLFVSSLGDVYRKMGNIEEAKKQYDLVEYIGLLSKINKVIYNRELALFYSDHDIKLEEALELATKELEVKRDIYTYDTLAWTLYKNNQLKEALDASLKSLRLGTKDAKLFFHAGMIYYKLGDMDKAKEHLSEALSINPYFHVIYSEVAEGTLIEIESKSRAAKGK